jgi:hypothetical protein
MHPLLVPRVIAENFGGVKIKKINELGTRTRGSFIFTRCLKMAPLAWPHREGYLLSQ